MNESPQLKEAVKARRSSFAKKGVIIALTSGLLYGIYGAFLTGATFFGEWLPWYGYGAEGTPGVGWYDAGTAAVITNTAGTYAVPMTFVMAVIILGALGSGLNDFFSAIWMLGKATIKGKFMDFVRSFKSKPGMVVLVCALIGGPIASTAFLVALIMAGPIATPISALCPAIGAIIGRIVFKQELNFRMACGIVICVVATFMIGSTAFTGLEFDGQFLIGLAIALISALGWGIEGAIAGFGTSVIDYEISITIRQVTSGIVTLFILVPILFLIAGNLGLYPTMLIEACQGPLFTDGVLSSPLVFLLISGLAAGMSFGFWYKGNSMCGAALGMACNGTFSFWVPFFSFLVLGLYLGGGDTYFLAPIQWAAAIVMVIGIFLIAVNPLDWFKKDKEA